MSTGLLIQSSIQTDPGRQVKENEDWCGTLTAPGNPSEDGENCCLWVIADGVGSYGTGREASSHAGPALCSSFEASPELPIDERLRASYHAANRVLWERRRAYVQQGSDRPVLTTGLAAVIQDSSLWIANVGDCRAYLVRSGQPHQLTIDHTWVNDQVTEGQ